MPSFFLAFLACVIVTAAGRESTSVARLSASLGQPAALLAAIWLSAIASSAFAAWLGAALAAKLFFEAKLVFAALALFLAAVELLVLRPRKQPAEPTRSFGAILIVTLATQFSDATRFLVLAMALATASPPLAGAGGAIACGIVLSIAWAMQGEWEWRLPIKALQLAASGLLMLAAIAAALSGLRLIA